MEPAPDSRRSEGSLPVFRAVSPSRREGFRRGCPSPARPGEPVRARTVGTVISRALDRAGTGGGGAHQLRYSSAGRWRRRSHHPHPHETRFPGHHRPLPRRHRRPVASGPGLPHLTHRRPPATVSDRSPPQHPPVTAHRVWTPAARAGHTGGEPPGNFGWLPLTGGSVEPPAEGIRKDTNGPDQASDADQHGAHLPGRLLVLANLDVVPALGLGHGPHLLSDSLFLPGKDTGCSGGGEGAEEGPTSRTGRPPIAPHRKRRTAEQNRAQGTAATSA